MNSWVLSVVEGRRGGDRARGGDGPAPALFLTAIADGPLDVPYLRQKAKLIASRDFSPSFRLRLAAKDATLVNESALLHDLDLPLFETIADRMGEGVAEHGDKDFSATYLTSAPVDTA